jgi:sulfhydrogenase subunit alpha
VLGDRGRCGVTVDGPIADLRRLLYCGEWIESHALHIYLLRAPDFLGYASGIEMATARRGIVERGLAIKKGLKSRYAGDIWP